MSMSVLVHSRLDFPWHDIGISTFNDKLGDWKHSQTNDRNRPEKHNFMSHKQIVDREMVAQIDAQSLSKD